eukprot:CAMPEP_0170555784 /NCGR_PEP_ID=MMETSP0211-20121228/13605_1 /TAXON_ID=311385 /ORGANISM="Pseudokeronopsis sp., Strain OXSARD2" /LENGTH=111 /DNA_ID=CAMNT_0010865773 /DNA_START=1048 /DNA_END=1380 /DNA_ORIENTATION=-
MTMLICDMNLFGLLVPLLASKVNNWDMSSSREICPIILIMRTINMILLMEEELALQEFKEAKANQFYLKLTMEGGLDTLEQLQMHPNQYIYELASRILERYSLGEEEVTSN